MVFILTGVFLGLIYVACLVFYRQSWKSIPTYHPGKILPHTFITVIIPARDEEENIGALLNCLKAQDYPSDLFEVIVIDDHSTDKTPDIVNGMNDPRIHLLSLKDHLSPGERLNSYKKKAIEIAIGQSKGDLIVTTDADCLVTPQWLSLFGSFYQQENPVFMAAPVAYMDETSFLKVFQSLDFMTLQGITGASVHKSVHTMCNGANLAYSKAAFYEVGGFRNIDAIASGDDMLLMHKMYLKYPDRIRFLKSENIIVRTAPMPTWKTFINQRIRWASKADKYDDKRIIWVLAMVYFWNVWFLVTGICSIFIPGLWKTGLIFLGINTIIEMWYLWPVASFFGKKALLWYFPLAEPFHILYTIVAGWLGKFGTYQWKGRQVK
jgi:cellulose synthase/poly-beta-1,6-N-acetylglucosamine synthase-like glycosyltransferase